MAAAAATATATTTAATAVWITPCSLSSPQCTNPKLFSLVANRSRGIIWSHSWNGMKSRTRLRVSQRSGNQQEDNGMLNQDDISYLLKLGAGCTVIALAIKYGSIIFPMITQPNILQALVMISTPVVISVLILIKESLSESKKEESADHLIWRCSKVRHCWKSLLLMMSHIPTDIHFLSSGRWLSLNANSRLNSIRFKALIAVSAWLIWKERCNCIFQNINPNLDSILSRAIVYCEAFFTATGMKNRELLQLNSSSNSIFIYSDASWNAHSNNAGLGFLILTNPGLILLAGALGACHDSPINAKIDAICHALMICSERNWKPDKIFCDCPGVAQLVQNPHPCIAWKSTGMILKLKNLLNLFPDICISTIPREKNIFADELAPFGSLNPHLSLFFRGMERPNWIEEICSKLSLFF